MALASLLSPSPIPCIQRHELVWPGFQGFNAAVRMAEAAV